MALAERCSPRERGHQAVLGVTRRDPLASPGIMGVGAVGLAPSVESEVHRTARAPFMHSAG
jgi:hypothetical protein